LSCDAGQIHYLSATYGSWSIPLDSIRVVGEFTNSDGPYLDDYFLVFASDSRDKWWEASYYAEGRAAVLSTLEPKFSGLSQLGLSNSTSFNSRVLWPAKHHGKPLFVCSKVPRPDGLSKSIVASLDTLFDVRIAEGLN
jgi:hypothetical protein